MSLRLLNEFWGMPDLEEAARVGVTEVRLQDDAVRQFLYYAGTDKYFQGASLPHAFMAKEIVCYSLGADRINVMPPDPGFLGTHGAWGFYWTPSGRQYDIRTNEWLEPAETPNARP